MRDEIFKRRKRCQGHADLEAVSEDRGLPRRGGGDTRAHLQAEVEVVAMDCNLEWYPGDSCHYDVMPGNLAGMCIVA